jgi:hypothetical protein
MDDIILTIIFMVAIATTTYFFGRLMTWMATKISPENFKKSFTGLDILKANIVMVISIVLWGVVFYNLI